MIDHTKISISQNGQWAGYGIIYTGIFYDCPASFGDPRETEAVYDAIEAAIARGESSVEHNGNRYSWTIAVAPQRRHHGTLPRCHPDDAEAT